MDKEAVGMGAAVTEAMMEAGARSLIEGQENRPGSSWAEEALWCYEAMHALAQQPAAQAAGLTEDHPMVGLLKRAVGVLALVGRQEADTIAAEARALLSRAAPSGEPIGYVSPMRLERMTDRNYAPLYRTPGDDETMPVYAAPQPSAQQAEPCPGCIPGGVCKTPTCGRLKAQQAEPKDCQHGYPDRCAAAASDGVVCPDDSCDIDDGIRKAEQPAEEARGVEWRINERHKRYTLQGFGVEVDFWFGDDMGLSKARAHDAAKRLAVLLAAPVAGTGQQVRAAPDGGSLGVADLQVVIDEHGLPVWCAAVPNACHDHINDAIDRGIDEAAKWVVRSYMRHPGYTAPQAAAGAQDRDDALDQALAERDRYHETADDLAAQIAAITNVDIGEHSSANDPWRNAMLAADDFIAAQLQKLLAVPSAGQPAAQPVPLSDEQIVKLRRETDQGAHAPRASDLAFARAILAQAAPSAGTGSFEIRAGGLQVAAASGPRESALQEATRYFHQYAGDATEDEPVELVEVTTLATTDSAASRKGE